MFSYIVRRLVMMIPVLIIIAIMAFTLIHITPGNPAAVMLGPDATSEDIARMERELGLHKPITQQFSSFIYGAVRGDLGISFYQRVPVTLIIIKRFPVTLSVALVAIIIAVLIAIPSGVLAAMKSNTIFDQAIMTGALFGVSMPSFWIGLLFILIIGVWLGWLPVHGYVSLRSSIIQWFMHILLPAGALGVRHAGLISRMTRSSMLDVLGEDYIRTARSKGIAEHSVYLKHALKNALMSIITIIGISFVTLLGGAMIIDVVFALPGLGRLLINSLHRRDIPVIQGQLIYIGLTCLVVNFLVDMTYAFIDPKIKYE